MASGCSHDRSVTDRVIQRRIAGHADAVSTARNSIAKAATVSLTTIVRLGWLGFLRVARWTVPVPVCESSWKAFWAVEPPSLL